MPTFDHHLATSEHVEPPPGATARTAQPAHGQPVALNLPRTVIRGESYQGGVVSCQDVAMDAPSSNRASIKCTDDLFIPLLQGIDSLELSCPGRTNGVIADELAKKKALAQDPDPRKQAKAQIELAGKLFEVCDKGARRYPYTLRNSAYYLKVLGAGGTSLPFVYAQVRNEYLWHVGPTQVRDEVLVLAAALGECHGPEVIARVDVFVDFRTSHDIETIKRMDWITRASYKQSHSVDDVFTGWSIGLKSPTQARLYNKPAEIEAVSQKRYLYDLWGKRGYFPGQSVWRLEFQIRREILKSLGLFSLDSVIDAQPALWQYLTSTFLRLAQENPSDATRSRWLSHPLWDRVANLSWSGNTLELSRTYQPAGIPSDKWLGIHGSSLLTSVMAKHGILDVEKGMQLLESTLRKYWNNRAVYEGICGESLLLEQVQLKARRFSTMDNNRDRKDEFRAYRQLERKW